MRRMLGMLMLLGVAACGRGGPDVLRLHTTDGVALMDPSDGRVTFGARGAVPSPDWSRVLRAEPAGSRTRLVALDPATGDELAGRTVDGTLEIGALSADGKLVALSPR